jgi:formate hydrogenlyase subunit 6/NADH:ubiquinone oxidoreductase subunit I
MSVMEMLAEEWQRVGQLRRLHIDFDAERCIGTWQCVQVCPIGCWTPDKEARVVHFHDGERCIACGACVLQCKPEAIQLTVD